MMDLAKEHQMNKRPAGYVFLGVLMGALLGAGIGVANGSTVSGMQLGALSGMFLGWILTAPAFQK